MMQINTLGYESDDLSEQAQQLADDLHFILDKNASACLFMSKHGLSIKLPGFSLLSADFSSAAWQKRAAEGKKQGLVRACKPAPGIKIIDTTAGWGRDAAVLSSFGAEVLMLERHPLMAALLADALSRQSDEDRKKMNLSIHNEQSHEYLERLSPTEYPDIIYIDPMHPERSKSALVKKDLQLLQQLIGPDEDAAALIKTAIKRVKNRVVVKWPQKSKALLTPNASIEGKTVRFDLYFPDPSSLRF